MRFAKQNLLRAAAFGASLAGAWAAAQSAPEAQANQPQILPIEAGRLLTLANEARAAAGASPLQWDSALTAAALQHCLRMAAEGPISHRYPGEAELTDRAGQAGAHFSVVEENIAAGSAPTDPIEIHQGWMNSPGHRANLLNSDVDSVGIAVIAFHDVTYAVADYARAVPVLTQAEVEAVLGRLLRSRGLSIFRDRRDARAYCAQPEGSKRLDFYNQPRYRMKWQNPDVTQLPPEFLDRLTAERYSQAAVGSCPPQEVQGQFTTYRVAVLLY